MEEQFLTRLALLVYILAGQPPRGTELFSIRYRNTMLGGTRNLFIDQGLVSLVTTYHKGYSISGSLKIIHRYLNPELSQYLVQYLAMIRPFVEQLSMLVYGQIDDSAFLWVKNRRPWDTNRMSAFLIRDQNQVHQFQLILSTGSWLIAFV